MIAHSTSKRNLKPCKLAPSSQQQALMVQVKWTTAQVVKYTVIKDSTLFTATMNVSKKHGYLRWSESAQRYNCTCPSHTGCRHQQILADYLGAKEVA